MLKNQLLVFFMKMKYNCFFKAPTFTIEYV